MENNITERNLKITFGGASHEIDADVLIQSLVNYSLVVQESSAHISPGSEVNIKIKATKEGSFELLLAIVVNSAGNLLSKDNVNYASSLVTIVGGLFGLKKFLSADPKNVTIESKDDSVLVKNNSGQIIINKNIYNIYQGSEPVRQGLSKTFEKLEKEEDIESFEIFDIDSGEEIFSVNRSEFGLMAKESNLDERKTQIEVRNNQELFIFKIVFKENHKWQFFYNNIPIYAGINDVDFLESVNKGKIAFRSGDKLVANIEILQVYNEAANTFVNDTYTVTQIISHVPRVNFSQESINFE